MKIIKLKKRGKFIAFHSSGNEVYEETVRQIKKGENIIVDFKGIGGVSASFASAYFSKIIREYGRSIFRKKIFVRNMNNNIKTIINLVTKDVT